VQGKKTFTLDPELTKRLSKFKTLEDFRLAVSGCHILYCVCLVSCCVVVSHFTHPLHAHTHTQQAACDRKSNSHLPQERERDKKLSTDKELPMEGGNGTVPVTASQETSTNKTLVKHTAARPSHN